MTNQLQSAKSDLSCQQQQVKLLPIIYRYLRQRQHSRDTINHSTGTAQITMLLKNKQGLSSDLLASLEKPEFCDIRLQSSDGEIPANKAVLSIRSEYFCRMFSPENNFVESSTGLGKLPYPTVIVKKVITYLYSGEMEVGVLALGQLLDLLELLNLMNLNKEFKQVESYAVGKISKWKFPFSECLKNLDKCSKMRMETLGEALMAHLLGKFYGNWCQLKEVGEVSETMMIRLIQENEEYYFSKNTLLRFKTFVTWLRVNAMDSDKKAEVLEMFDFELFTAEELASVVRTSGLYSSDKIIARMGEICRIQEDWSCELESRLEEKDEGIGQLEGRLEDRDDDIVQLEIRLEGKDDEIGNLKEELKDKDCEIDNLDEELRREETIFEFELSVKDQKISQLKKEKTSLEKVLNNKKRKIEDPISKCKAAKY